MLSMEDRARCKFLSFPQLKALDALRAEVALLRKESQSGVREPAVTDACVSSCTVSTREQLPYHRPLRLKRALTKEKEIVSDLKRNRVHPIL